MILLHALLALAAGSPSTPTVVAPAPSAPEDVDYARDVHPILVERCFQCHGPDKQKGDLRLDLREGLFEGDEYATPVVPGDVEASLLYELVSLPADDPDRMPPEGDPLTEDQLATLRAWIEAGAPWTEVLDAARKEERLVLPPLDPEQAAAREAALGRLRELGGVALPVARDLHAVDVNLSLLRAQVGDEQVGLLKGLEPSLVWLDLSGTAVRDEGVGHLGAFRQLRRLNLSRTAVTDAGLQGVAGLPELRVLNLYGTAVGDAGLAHLAGLPKLERLYLWDTQVTDAGVEGLLAARPALRVNRGVEPAEPPSPPQPGPINTTCPVSGQPADGSVLTVLDGRTVAFCCTDCKAKFDADPEKYAEKLPAETPEEVPAAAPVNAKCPVSGADVDPARTVTYEGRVVGFCCEKCQTAFEADPAKFAGKLPPAGPVNAKCPVSGADVDAAQTVTYEGRVVGFCCAKCKAAFEADPAKYADKIGG